MGGIGIAMQIGLVEPHGQLISVPVISNNQKIIYLLSFILTRKYIIVSTNQLWLQCRLNHEPEIDQTADINELYYLTAFGQAVAERWLNL